MAALPSYRDQISQNRVWAQYPIPLKHNPHSFLNLYVSVKYVCASVCVLFQVLCHLLPAIGVSTQDDPDESGSHAQWLLAHSHIYLLSTHHAKLERHRDRGYCKSSLAQIRNHH